MKASTFTPLHSSLTSFLRIELSVVLVTYGSKQEDLSGGSLDSLPLNLYRQAITVLNYDVVTHYNRLIRFVRPGWSVRSFVLWRNCLSVLGLLASSASSSSFMTMARSIICEP
jgi:hypothetical protein